MHAGRGHLYVAACLAALLAAPIAAADEQDRFELSLRAAGSYGPVSGFVQVPLGGEPGSSSARRPTLRELGIDDAASYEVTARLRFGSFALFGGYAGLDLASSGTLGKSLVSHGVAFAAGSPAKTSLQLGVPYLGAGWRLAFDGGRLELFPKVDVALLDFSYALDSPDAHAARAYRRLGIRLGAEASYRLGHGFALELDGAAPLPVGSMPQLASVTGRLSYHLSPLSRVRPTLFLGVAGRWIDFHDSQTLPNHSSVRLGPLVTGGFALAF
jgi:hypothetical protein